MESLYFSVLWLFACAHNQQNISLKQTMSTCFLPAYCVFLRWPLLMKQTIAKQIAVEYFRIDAQCASYNFMFVTCRLVLEL